MIIISFDLTVNKLIKLLKIYFIKLSATLLTENVVVCFPQWRAGPQAVGRGAAAELPIQGKSAMLVVSGGRGFSMVDCC